MSALQIFSAEKFVSPGKSPGEHLAENIIGVKDPAALNGKLKTGPFEFSFKHGNIKGTQIVTGQIASFEIVVEFLCNISKSGALRHIGIINTVNSRSPGRDRHFRIESAHSGTAFPVRRDLQHSDFHDPVTTGGDAGTFNVKDCDGAIQFEQSFH